MSRKEVLHWMVRNFDIVTQKKEMIKGVRLFHKTYGEGILEDIRLPQNVSPLLPDSPRFLYRDVRFSSGRSTFQLYDLRWYFYDYEELIAAIWRLREEVEGVKPEFFEDETWQSPGNEREEGTDSTIVEDFEERTVTELAGDDKKPIEKDEETESETIEESGQEISVAVAEGKGEGIEHAEREREKIRQVVEEREIPYLVHFTPIENLSSILVHGLLSRNELKQQGIPYRIVDENRLDALLDYISLSVSFPNYRMFYRKRNESKEETWKWAILLIQPEVLYTLDCLFFKTNAASGEVLKERSNISKFSTAEAFVEMFYEHENRQKIPPFYSTDPQAEVMVKERVPLPFFTAIVVQDETHRNFLLSQGLDVRLEVRVDSRFYGPRADWEYWRKKEESPEGDQ